ncbi:MAG: right-handed parallel beta-helix repeat-containing protein [Planctomycetota bacterium]
MKRIRIAVGAIAGVLWVFEPSPVQGQGYPGTPPIYYYVDAVEGDDGNSGGVNDPFRTITRGVQAGNETGRVVEVRVRAKTNGGSVVTYSDASGETLPLEPRRGVSIVRDVAGSEPGVPVVIESTLNATIIRIGTHGLSDYSRSRFQNLTIRNGGKGVEIVASATGQTVAPRFAFCLFDSNLEGIRALTDYTQTAASGQTINPTIQSSTFTTSRNATSHVYFWAKEAWQGNKISGTIGMCTFTIDPAHALGGTQVTHAIKLRASDGSTVNPTITASSVRGYGTGSGSGGIQYGLVADSANRSAMPCTFSGGLIDGCRADGLLMKSLNDADPPPAQPTIAASTISDNGGNGIMVYGGLNAYLSPEIENNQISGNGKHGVYVLANRGLGVLPIRVAPTISKNTISSNGPATPTLGIGNGIFLRNVEGTISGSILNNVIDSNRLNGIAIYGLQYAGTQTPRTETQIANNLIKGHNSASVLGTGIALWSYYPAELWPKVVHNTITGNFFGIKNWDAPGNFHSQGFKVFNTILEGNDGGGDMGSDMDFAGGQVQFCNWRSGFGLGVTYFYNKHEDPHFLPDGFHLSITSPLIDAATETPPVYLELDFDGDPRTIDLIPPDTDKDNDMGVDEVTAA